MHAFNWKNGFQRLHKKRILFYRAKGSHARSHHTFNSRLTSVFIKRSSVKRTVHGRFFFAHTVYTYSDLSLPVGV